MHTQKNPKKNKTIGIVAASVVAGSSAMAQEAGGNIDLSAASDAAGEIAAAIQGLLLGSVLDGVVLVVGASLAVWAVVKVVGWIRKGAK